jgi:general secretion pathway protein K
MVKRLRIGIENIFGLRLRSLLSRYRNERGMALLATMLAIALMTLIVVDFTTSSAMGYLSAANQANEIRASYLARSAINIGLALLAQDSRAQQAQSGSSGVSAVAQPFVSFASVLAIPFPPMPLNGGTVELSVVDEARKFNINSLINTRPQTNFGGLGTGQIDPNAVLQLTRLVSILGASPAIVPPIVDWLDRDSVDSPGGAEADYYLRLIPPYEPRNGPMPTLGDLRMVKGVDDATFMLLRNYLTVAPEIAVNANTASPEVIACLEPELAASPRLVGEIIQARTVKPFSNLTDVLNLPGVSDLQAKLNKDLTTRGNYFTISGMGTFAGARKIVNATFHRNGDGTGTLGSWQED